MQKSIFIELMEIFGFFKDRCALTSLILFTVMALDMCATAANSESVLFLCFCVAVSSFIFFPYLQLYPIPVV